VSTIPRLNYTPLERLPMRRPVDRIGFIARACAGRYVLDLGAMDETAWIEKRGKGTWLHEVIAAAGRRVDGVDSSAFVPAEGLRTGPNSTIRRGDATDPGSVLSALEETPEVIVAGELIEHLESPLQFLKRIAALPQFKGATLLLTTPNATALHNCLVALVGRESTHHDHLCILSYKTLTTLCARAGFRDCEIIPYYARFTEMKERHKGLARIFVLGSQLAINVLEWMFPLLSFGYVVRVQL
jgi:hypothetical protein